jgi:ferric-dicitrate binding protein FerR (iron transport regulator)
MYSIGAIAASTVIVLTVAFIYVFINTSTSAVVFETLPGEKITVTLPDETIVMLNGNSTLSYDQDTWDSQQLRPVRLTGEAYFKVKSDKARPFVVSTSGITIRVLGTTFNVKSYDEDHEIETTLIEGKVLIENEGGSGRQAETLELLPEQQATFTKASRTLALRNVPAKRAAGWVSGTLVFEDEAFADIIKDLERWYGVRIVVRDKSAMSCRFNSKIERESLEEVLKMFSATSEMKYFFRDKTNVVIEGNVCSTPQVEYQPLENNDETGF